MLNKQQQIALSFIEETKINLNLIERSVINLHNTVQDLKIVNAVFRAAHSIKGGAAMLGYQNIQQTAHCLEDYFAILKESLEPSIEQNLKILLLQVVDTLKELLKPEKLFCAEDEVNKQVKELTPALLKIEEYLKLSTKANSIRSKQINYQVYRQINLSALTKQILPKLREMLNLFKQIETPQTRQQLQECCYQLMRLGKQFNLSGWCNLCETAAGAIANGKNTYRTLAPLVIKELKHSQELVIAGRGEEIITSQRLQALARDF